MLIRGLTEALQLEQGAYCANSALLGLVGGLALTNKAVLDFTSPQRCGADSANLCPDDFLRHNWSIWF